MYTNDKKLLSSIPNPPNAPAGYVAEWDGTKWEIVEITKNIVPAKPTNLPDGYTAEWDGKEWVISPPPPPPPPPTDVEVTVSTIYKAVYCLQTVDHLTTDEMKAHITDDSKKIISDFIHDVANILARAQIALDNEERYEPAFPPIPTVITMIQDGVKIRPTIRFIEVE